MNFLFDANYLNMMVGNIFLRYGVEGAHHNNYLKIIETLFADVLDEEVDYTRITIVKQSLFEYCRNHTAVEEVVGLLLQNISRTLASVPRGMEYGINTVDGTIYVFATPKKHEMSYNEFEASVLDTIRKDIDSGHYVPERLRRVAGY